jgi:hypothetical protein
MIERIVVANRKGGNVMKGFLCNKKLVFLETIEDKQQDSADLVAAVPKVYFIDQALFLSLQQYFLAHGQYP